MNLSCKAAGNIALHFNPRLDRGYIVRNTRLRGIWDDEETCSPAGPSGCIFRRNAYMHLMIFCTNDAFQVKTERKKKGGRKEAKERERLYQIHCLSL